MKRVTGTGGEGGKVCVGGWARGGGDGGRSSEGGGPGKGRGVPWVIMQTGCKTIHAVVGILLYDLCMIWFPFFPLQGPMRFGGGVVIKGDCFCFMFP